MATYGSHISSASRGFPPAAKEPPLRQPNLIHPTYADSFRCIGPACEDNCCGGWIIPVDEAACDKFSILPASPLRTLIDASVLRTPPNADGSKPDIFATLRMTESKRCPLLSEESLCRIQCEYGETHLPHACAIYPRIVDSVDNIEEKALALSCPEAARLVLLNPDLLKLGNPASGEATSPVTPDQQPQLDQSTQAATSLRPWFRLLRQSALALVINRTLPLWQRMFLLGVFCKQLDAIAAGELKLTVPEFLHDFEAMIASGIVPSTLEGLPRDRAQQLDVVLRLAGMLLQSNNIHSRFVECVQFFTAGIGNGPGATFESLTAHYTSAHDRYYEPFFSRQPHILENYLINTMIRYQFPFGREAMRAGVSPSMAREHLLLTAQFALMKGFLIAVTGFHREAFSVEHVVHTVQSVSKHFEHHFDFLNQAYALLVESQMNNERGVAIMLRDDRTASQSAELSASLRSQPGVAAGRRLSVTAWQGSATHS